MGAPSLRPGTAFRAVGVTSRLVEHELGVSGKEAPAGMRGPRGQQARQRGGRGECLLGRDGLPWSATHRGPQRQSLRRSLGQQSHSRAGPRPPVARAVASPGQPGLPAVGPEHRGRGAVACRCPLAHRGCGDVHRPQRHVVEAAATRYGISPQMVTYRLNVTGVRKRVARARGLWVVR